MPRIRSCVVLCCAFLTACVSAPPIGNSLTLVDKPAVNEVATAELGGLVLEKGRYRVVDAVNSRDDIRWSTVLGDTFIVPSGLLVAQRRDAQYTYYVSNRTIITNAIDGVRPAGNVGLRVRNSDPADAVGINFFTGVTNKLDQSPVLETTQVFRFDASGYRLQLVYGGRAGDVLTFQYRESSGGMTQPQVNQDFQWNLADGHVVVFKGAHIEVEDATNARLNYRVVSSFANADLQ